MAFARPNRLRLVAKLGAQALTVVSTGKELALAGYGAGRVTEQEVPPTLVAATDAERPTLVDSTLAAALPGGLARVVAAALAADPLAAMMRGEFPAFVATEDVDGVSCHRLTLPVDGRTVSLWIDVGDTPLIRKAGVDLPPPAEGQAEGGPAGLVEVSFSATWDLNANPPPETFALPPSDQPTPPNSGPPRKGLLGDYVTDFTGTLLDGGTYELAEHAGKELVVLAFWSPRDASGMDLASMLAKIADDYRGKKVSVCTVAVAASADSAKAVLSGAGVTVPVVLDPDRAIARTWGITATPVTTLIGPDAKVRLLAEGFPGWLPERLHDLLDRMLEHTPPPAG
jgi:peroxiredoxin